jgi:integration host factor subunit beta
MTKSELIEAIANKLKLPKGKAELIVNCVFDSMEASLRRGERIEIRGFGSFEIRSYQPYEGRNPRTGARVDVKSKRLPFFKVGKELKERVNAAAAAAPAQPPATAQPAQPAKPVAVAASGAQLPRPTDSSSAQPT